MRLHELVKISKLSFRGAKPEACGGDPSGGNSKPIHYFGTTRFSVFSPDSSDWLLSRTQGAIDPERYEKTLFSDSRMKPRVHIFCNIAAPLYQKMAERHSFCHFVFYSPRMPARWQDQLKEASTTYPVLKLVPVDTARIDINSYARQHLVDIGERQESLVFIFRVDDDDLLSIDYLDQVEPLMVDEHDGFAISFADGYAGIFENGEFVNIRKFTQSLTSIGQGVIGRWLPGRGELAIRLLVNHTKTHYRRTVLLDAQRPTFIQTRHTGQDTALTEGRGEAADPEAQKRAILSKFERLKPVETLKEFNEQFPSIEKFFKYECIHSVEQAEPWA